MKDFIRIFYGILKLLPLVGLLVVVSGVPDGGSAQGLSFENEKSVAAATDACQINSEAQTNPNQHLFVTCGGFI